jgi:hypothetical protein
MKPQIDEILRELVVASERAEGEDASDVVAGKQKSTGLVGSGKPPSLRTKK